MRSRLVPIVTALFVLAVPGTALAEGSLEEYLSAMASSDFHGRGLTVCSWEGESAGAVYEVTRSEGMTMVSGTGGDVMTMGGTTAMRSGAGWHGFAIAGAAPWTMSGRYVMSDPVATERLGRPATLTTLLQDGMPRVEIVADDATGAPLLVQVRDGSGAVFRVSALLEVSPAAPMEAARMGEMGDMAVMEAAEAPDRFPAETSGYRRADAYTAGDAGLHVYYSDGLFSFSVFEAKRGAPPDGLAAASVWKVAGREYRRLVTPAHVWVHWNGPDHSYLLVGDLPPDHLERVLEDLPEPGERSLLVRLWRRLFG